MTTWQQLHRAAVSISLTLLLAACGSSVKLDDVPVEDRTGTTASAATGADTGKPAAAADSGAGARPAVATVNLGTADSTAGGPAATARIVYFDYDSYAIKSEFQTLIEAHARFLKANTARKVVVEGHTDERGGREYNLALGQKRSEAVRKALSLLGVADAQVEAVSFGKEKPADVASNEAAWSKNRRAEITYR